MRTIGRIDKADFPDLGLENIDVKIDTGAYTSSIHCHHIKRVKGSQPPKVSFRLLDPAHPDYNEKAFELPISRIKTVKSSTGNAKKRIFIKTTILLFGKKIKTELSLADRSDMRYPILLGRKLLKKKFIVDVAKKYLSFKQKAVMGK